MAPTCRSARRRGASGNGVTFTVGKPLLVRGLAPPQIVREIKCIMSLDLFLVRFSNSHIDRIPMAEAEPILKMRGELRRIDERLLLWPPETSPIASWIDIGCDGRELVTVALNRPYPGPHLRAFLFDLMRQLGMALICPSGGPVLVAADRRVHLPDHYRKDAVVVTSADEIYPEPLA